MATLRPHKSEIANNVGVYIGALLGIGSTVYVFTEVHLPPDTQVIFAVAVLMSTPHFVFFGYITFRCLALKQCSESVAE